MKTALFDKRVMEFQQRAGIKPDGLLGHETLSVLQDILPTKPAKPPMTEAQKVAAYGDPLGGRHLPYGQDVFTPDPAFDQSVVRVAVPLWFAARGSVRFHVQGSARLTGLLKAWETAGLHRQVRTFNGSVAYRRVRSGLRLSSHAFGIAFDINTPWNALGALPALPWEEGSVVELARVAGDCGFYWGGHFSRMDGMHLELSQ